MAGLLSFLSPCVLPLVPGYLGFLSNVSQSDDLVKARIALVIASTAFVAGFITVFVALGASSSLASSFIARHMEFLQLIAGGVIAILGVHFLGLFSFRFLDQDIRFMPSKKGRGTVGAFVVGLAFGFGWTPCIGPVLATILMISAGVGGVAQGMSLLLAYGIGLGAPFILVAVFTDFFMSKFRYLSKSMLYVKWLLGSFLILTGLLIMTGNFAEIGFWMLRNAPIFQQVG